MAKIQVEMSTSLANDCMPNYQPLGPQGPRGIWTSKDLIAHGEKYKLYGTVDTFIAIDEGFFNQIVERLKYWEIFERNCIDDLK
jgi:hypothetical protein